MSRLSITPKEKVPRIKLVENSRPIQESTAAAAIL
jgi:hypothetical protein